MNKLLGNREQAKKACSSGGILHGPYTTCPDNHEQALRQSSTI